MTREEFSELVYDKVAQFDVPTLIRITRHAYSDEGTPYLIFEGYMNALEKRMAPWLYERFCLSLLKGRLSF